MGSRRFELLISAMSRRRHNQSDYEPIRNNEMLLLQVTWRIYKSSNKRP